MNLFTILKDILVKQGGELHKSEEFNKAFSPYMLVRYLSMKPELLPYSIAISRFMKVGLTNKTIYKWCYKNIPKQRSSYIKYMKKKKQRKIK